MDSGTISTRYAKAIYKYAAGRGDETRLYEEMKTLSKQFPALPELNKVLENPIISSEEKIKLLTTAVGETASETCKNVLRVVVENGRASYMRQIALVYDQVYRKAKNIVLVKLTTVIGATDKEKQSMVELISRPTSPLKGESEQVPHLGGGGGIEQVDFAAETDADIIGGFILEVEDLRLDASVKNQLNKLKLELIK